MLFKFVNKKSSLLEITNKVNAFENLSVILFKVRTQYNPPKP